jgi:hypothetical protein
MASFAEDLTRVLRHNVGRWVISLVPFSTTEPCRQRNHTPRSSDSVLAETISNTVLRVGTSRADFYKIGSSGTSPPLCICGKISYIHRIVSPRAGNRRQRVLALDHICPFIISISDDIIHAANWFLRTSIEVLSSLAWKK